MPMYRMGCNDCGAEHDVFRTIARIDADLPECCGATMQRRVCAPMVVTDIAPYQAMGVDVATGRAPVIGSRSAHRDYLKRNGYVEIGNEQPKLRTKVHGDFVGREELRQVVRDVLPKYTR